MFCEKEGRFERKHFSRNAHCTLSGNILPVIFSWDTFCPEPYSIVKGYFVRLREPFHYAMISSGKFCHETFVPGLLVQRSVVSECWFRIVCFGSFFWIVCFGSFVLGSFDSDRFFG